MFLESSLDGPWHIILLGDDQQQHVGASWHCNYTFVSRVIGRYDLTSSPYWP